MSMTTTMSKEAEERIATYLDDLISLESAGITGMKDFIRDATDPQDAAMFQEHLNLTESQKKRLEVRLKALGHDHNPNVIKEWITKAGAAASDMLHATKNKGDEATRNLIQAYTIECLEIASYESLVAAATEVGDTETANLAKEIQAEEEASAKKIFGRIDPMARKAVLAGDKA